MTAMPSFWKSRSPQTIDKPGTIFRAAKWRQDIPEIGKAKLGIELAQPLDDLPRFWKPPGQSVAYRRNANRK